MENINKDEKITFRLIDDFVCDNVDFGQSESNNVDEINNFYGIIYHLITHSNNIYNFNNTTVYNRELNEVFISSMECVFSCEYTSAVDKYQEAPYSGFWKQIMESGKDFLALLSSEKIQENSQKANDEAYVKKLSDLLNELQVSIKIEDQKISVVSVVSEAVKKVEEKKIEAENKNNKIDNIIKIEKREIEKKNEIGNPNDKTDDGNKQNKKGAKEPAFPAWEKILIGVVIAAIAIVLLLLGFGVIGALAGAAKTAMLIIGAVTLFAELIYVAALYIFSGSNELPGGGSGYDISVQLINEKTNEKTLKLEDKEQIPKIKMKDDKDESID